MKIISSDRTSAQKSVYAIAFIVLPFHINPKPVNLQLMLLGKTLGVGIARRRHRFEFCKLDQARNTDSLVDS
ncbi:hypothetical protein [Nostoc sp.]|uniref:hypothetical protein n=1 Tax=Nostoc sp. TaxID=1180 RepID=UPI002FF58B82